MRRRLAPLVVLALVAGCGGGDDEETGGAHTETLPLGPEATDICLGERGFSLRPAASGVSAVAPNGVEFTVTFFSSDEDAKAAASKARGSTAYENAVVTPSGKQLSRADRETVAECIRGEGS
jgi:hypothetical protein